MNDLEKKSIECIKNMPIEETTYQLARNVVLDYITNLQEENERLKELCNKYEEEHSTTFEYWKRLVKEDYKSRNEKAIEYNYKLQERYCHSALFDDLVASKIYEITEKQLNILRGDDKK